MHLPDWMSSISSLWLLQLFTTVLATVAASYVLHLAVVRLQGHLQKNSADWDDVLVEAARAPLRLMIWVLGLGTALAIVDVDIRNWDAVLDSARRVGVIVAVAWFAFRFAGGYQNIRIQRLQDQAAHDPTAILAIGRLLRASIVITTALVILETLGFSISGVLAFGGIGGVAVGFAAKDMLANFFGGLMIFLDRPFTVGDAIKSPDRTIEGIVEHIGWRMTIVRNYDKEPVYIPNSTFSSIAVVTPSRMTHRRIREVIGLRYEDMERLPGIADRVRALLDQHPQLDSSQGQMVRFDHYGESALEIVVQCFTATTAWGDFMQLKEEILLDIARIIAEAGADFAFPTQTMHVNLHTDEQLAGKREGLMEPRPTPSQNSSATLTPARQHSLPQ